MKLFGISSRRAERTPTDVVGRARVLIFAPLYPPAYLGGGPIRSISATVEIAMARHDLHVLTRDSDLGADAPLAVDPNVWLTRDGVQTKYVSTKRLGKYIEAIWSSRRVRPQIVYINGFFDPQMSLVPQFLAGLRWWTRAQRLIAVRGEFGAAALAIKPRKKSAVLALYRLLQFHEGVPWHASSQREADDVRRVFGNDAKVIIRANDSLVVAERDRPPTESSGPLRAVFLGRVVPIKGLDVLLEAMNGLRAPVQLDIYGPAEDDAYAAVCLALAKRLPNGVDADFRGPITPDRVRSMLAQYDVLLMPTKGENFGHVFVEALSVGLPCVAMDVTPWTAVLREGGGVVVEGPGVEAWREVVQDLASAPEAQRSRMRQDATIAFDHWLAQRSSTDLFTEALTQISST